MVGAALLWSTGGLLIKVVRLDPAPLVAWRSFFALLTVALFARARGMDRFLRGSRVQWAGAVCYAYLLTSFVVATRRTTAANAIFLQYTAPVYLLFLEPVFLKTQFRYRDLAMVVAALFGMSLFFAGQLRPGELSGNLVALTGGLVLAALGLILRHQWNNDAGRWRTVILGNAVALVAVGLIALLQPGAVLPSSATDMLSLAYLGVFQIGAAYLLFLFAIRYLTALEAALVGMLEPVCNPVWVFLGTGERPSSYALLGGVLILACIVLRTLIAEPRRDRG
ncbi:MAG: DMT family transporter [Acidobacteria bacterium]|nr:DMT family transporter [Acidobacteriota bacterium]